MWKCRCPTESGCYSGGLCEVKLTILFGPLTVWSAGCSQVGPSEPGAPTGRSAVAGLWPPTPRVPLSRRHGRVAVFPLRRAGPRRPLSMMNTSACDNHFLPWKCNDDVISRALLWVCKYQTHDPSSTVNCLRVGINLVPCNVEKRFVGWLAGSMCAGRPAVSGPVLLGSLPPWRSPRILIAAACRRLFSEMLLHGLHYHANLFPSRNGGWAH